MDKNTIWAIVLSAVVLIASYIIMPFFIPGMRPELSSGVQNEIQDEQVAENSEEQNLAEISTFVNEELSSVGESTVLSEELITVDTDVAEIVLTNKGGDIISYKLKNHYDMDTGTGVQLSDNVNDFNRTCALAFGTVESKIINEYFSVDKIDDYTYLFKKSFVQNDGRQFTLGKKYSFKNGEYVFKLDVLIHTDDSNGLGKNDVAYTIRTSPQLGPHYDPKQNRYETRQFVTYNGSKSKRVVLSQGQFKRFDKDFIWNGIAGKYFVELMIPSAPETINSGYYSSKVEVNNYSNAQAFIERKSFNSGDIQDTYYMYFGPRNENDLKRYNIPENNAWGIGGKKVTDCLQSSGWLSWLERILKVFLEVLHKVVPNWGLSIIIMTLIIKIILFPLSKKQSMGTLKMQELQPKMQALQEKYKNDQQKLQAETAKLYQEAGYNPASGCLPMLFQFLLVLAMYNLFNNYFEFRGAMFIPHWIPDLSAGESVYTIQKFAIPFIGNQIRILPVIYVATQLISGKITQYGQTGAQNNASMKFMMYGMPLIFFFIFYNAPAGLLLYWLTSNVLQTIQQLIINNMMKKKKSEIQNNKNVAGKPQKTLPPKNKRK